MWWRDKEQDCMRKGNKRKQLFSGKDTNETCIGKKIQETIMESMRKDSTSNGINTIPEGNLHQILNHRKS